MSRPLVSVVVITYNHEEYIREALESVLMQETSFDFEVVVGEDCSTDETRSILLQLAEAHPHRIQVVLAEKNQGWLKNFNETVAQCRGEYIAWLEGDDYWTSPQKLQRQVDFLQTHPECALCFTRVRKFEDGGRELDTLPNVPVQEISEIRDIIACQFIQTCSVMIRTSALTPMPAWFEGLKLGDWPYWILTAQQGKLGFIDEVMAAYRVHPGGIWSGKDPVFMCREVIRMFERLHDHIAPEFRNLVRSAISREYFELSWLLRMSGKKNLARKAIARCVRVQPLNPHLSKPRVAAMWMRYHTPVGRLFLSD